MCQFSFGLLAILHVDFFCMMENENVANGGINGSLSSPGETSRVENQL
jgi:hypothetical protein